MHNTIKIITFFSFHLQMEHVMVSSMWIQLIHVFGVNHICISVYIYSTKYTFILHVQNLPTEYLTLAHSSPTCTLTYYRFECS